MSQRVIQRCVFPFERRLMSLYYRLERAQDSRLLDPEPPGRFSIWIARGSKLVTDTYFNSFFEAYWRRYTKLGRLCLRVELSGRGTLTLLRRSNSAGLHILQEVDFDEDQPELVFEIPELQLHHRELGSLHFDIVARSNHVQLKRAEWIALDVEDEPMGMVAGYCTFNREKFLLNNVKSLLEDQEVADSLERLVVIDQGTKKVKDHPVFDDLPPNAEGKLEVIEQGNFGGTGGFTRSILEARGIRGATHMLLMDDDAVTEPESVFRAVAFQALARGDIGVGGPMLDMLRPMEVYEAGAMVEPATLGVSSPIHRLNAAPVTSLDPFLDVVHTQYNAWWFFAFPLRLVDQVGLPMPLFIRGDDVEFGYRLHQAGVPTTAVPGLGIWHEPFYLKKGGWQAYYDLRNMMALTAIHFGMPTKLMMRNYLKRLFTQLFSLNYYEASLIIEAVVDYCQGPSILDGDPQVIHRKLLALRKDFPAESVSRTRCLPIAHPAPPPVSKLQRLRHTVKCIWNQWFKPSPPAEMGPGHVLPEPYQRWWCLALSDVVAVEDWHMENHQVFRRSREAFRKLFPRGIKVAAMLYRNHERVAGEWRAAHHRLTRIEFWDKYLGLDRREESREPEMDHTQRAA